MKRILGLTMTMALILGVAASGFAVVNSNKKLPPVNMAEQQTKARKHSVNHRAAGRKTAGNRRTTARRGYRLTNSQRRYWNQKLLDIYLN